MLKEIKNKQYFSRGKRGIIYVGRYRNKKAVIKTKREESKAAGRIKNEAKWLRILNKYNIGPKFLFFENNSLVYEFVEGDFIFDFLKKSDKKDIKTVIKKIFEQLYKLDMLKVNKEEMHHPVKHILIKDKMIAKGLKKNIVLIDFERCYKTEKPHNVTQFCQFLMSRKISKILEEKGFKIERKKITELAKNYKKEISRKNLKAILDYFV